MNCYFCREPGLCVLEYLGVGGRVEGGYQLEENHGTVFFIVTTRSFFFNFI